MVLTVLFAKDGGYIYVQKVYQPAFKPDDPAGRRMGAGGGERGGDAVDGGVSFP